MNTVAAAAAARILLVDDDVELASMLSEYLTVEGFETVCAHSGEQGIEQAARQPFDAIVLDVMLPGVNGIEVLRRLRERSPVPVLMLTARGDHVDRIVGLELGADDYVPKPCPPRELVARLRAILRRTRGGDQAGGMLNAGLLVLWPARRRVTCNGTPLTLTSTEFNLLEVLLRDVGRVVSKQDLYSKGLGRPMGRFERSIDVHISSIRHKLADAAGDRLRIESVRGVGYQLVVE
ncbi:MAG TPA: response regulator transcription factor [Burkholderiaceae bacterium]|nr:response regulator transcription factor [Burkholderiaceae bacterium]